MQIKLLFGFPFFFSVSFWLSVALGKTLAFEVWVVAVKLPSNLHNKAVPPGCRYISTFFNRCGIRLLSSVSATPSSQLFGATSPGISVTSPLRPSNYTIAEDLEHVSCLNAFFFTLRWNGCFRYSARTNNSPPLSRKELQNSSALVRTTCTQTWSWRLCL